MADIEYRNLDQCDAFGRLAEVTRPRLADVLTTERLLQFETPAGAGLSYNYAAKTANEQVIDLLQTLADQQQVIDKYREILDGRIMNTGCLLYTSDAADE